MISEEEAVIATQVYEEKLEKAKKARAVALTLIGLRRFRKPQLMMDSSIPLDIVLIISRLVYGSRSSPEWVFSSKDAHNAHKREKIEWE